MKIYFGFTILGDRSRLEHGKEIVKLLEKKGHIVLTKHVFEDNAYELDGKMSEEKVFERDMKWLREADTIIIDASGSSFGVGFETGFALGAMSKKVFLVYDAKNREKISRMARGLIHKNCVKFEYSSFEELKNFVERNF